jgi:hypothetical protein
VSAAGKPFALLRWLPAAAGAAYVVTVVALGRGLVDALNWDTDASAPLALAERLRGSGIVSIPHYGEWTSLWWLLATRGLPWHAQLWGASGYALALMAAALVGWATSRVCGRWAGLTAAVVAVAVGPYALRSLLSLALHVTNPFGAAVLAAGVVLLPRMRSWLVALGIGALAGVNAASDPLLWIAGLIPFAIAAAYLAWTTRRVETAVRAGTTVVAAATSAFATNVVMHELGFRVIGLSVQLAPVHDLPANVRHLGRMLALVGGANYALPGGGYPREPLRALIALLAFAGIAAPVLAAAKFARRRAAPIVRAYACYWGAATVALCVIFVITRNAAALGPNSANYLLTLPLAAGAGVALLAAGSRRAQYAVAVAAAVVASVNIAGLAGGRANLASTPLRTNLHALVKLLQRNNATRGYAGYWDAQNLSWQSGMRLLVSPVVRCGEALCPNSFFSIRSWYEGHDGRSFLLVDPTNGVIDKPPPFVAEARSTHHFGLLTLYVFDYDIARHIRLES